MVIANIPDFCHYRNLEKECPYSKQLGPNLVGVNEAKKTTEQVIEKMLNSIERNDNEKKITSHLRGVTLIILNL